MNKMEIRHLCWMIGSFISTIVLLGMWHANETRIECLIAGLICLVIFQVCLFAEVGTDNDDLCNLLFGDELDDN